MSLLSWLWVFWDVTVQKILNGSVRVVPGSSEGFDNLISGESHGHNFVNDGFAGLILLLWLRFRLRFRLWFFLLFGRFWFDLFDFGDFLFFLLFFLRLRFLELGNEVL